MSKMLTIGIVAGEVSGDALGADFMQQMNVAHPNIRWIGVGGQSMAKLGLHSIIDMNRLSVMGLTEVVMHLPDLLRAKREILAEFSHQDIDIFIGIDAPDFNLRLGRILKPRGVFCVQLVSPSIWAWRENRIHTIKAATNLVLCLFPFELGVYAKHHHPAVCVGHPLLDRLQADKRTLSTIRAEFITNYRTSFPALKTLNSKTILCMMAGSRLSEIRSILPLLIDSMDCLANEQIKFILPVVDAKHAKLVEEMLYERAPHLLSHACVIYDTKTAISHAAMKVSDVVVLASGTATFEAIS